MKRWKLVICAYFSSGRGRRLTNARRAGAHAQPSQDADSRDLELEVGVKLLERKAAALRSTKPDAVSHARMALMQVEVAFVKLHVDMKVREAGVCRRVSPGTGKSFGCRRRYASSRGGARSRGNTLDKVFTRDRGCSDDVRSMLPASKENADAGLAVRFLITGTMLTTARGPIVGRTQGSATKGISPRDRRQHSAHCACSENCDDDMQRRPGWR